MEDFDIKKDPENGCYVGDDGCHYDTKQEVMYYCSLGFCGCGNPSKVHKFTIDCLTVFDRDNNGGGYEKLVELVKSNPEAAADFIVYALDEKDLIEHGGSIYGSWLTHAGKKFIDIGPMQE